MALFWQKGNKKEVKETKPTAKTPAKIENKQEKKMPVKTENLAEKRTVAVAGGVIFPKGSAVIKPRVTEKTGILAEKGIYTFEVLKNANSQQISTAIKVAYKVTPIKISIAPIKSKTMFARGKSGRTVSGKKAYVYLKFGDKIEFI